MPPGTGLTIRPLGNFVQYLQQLFQAPPNTIRNIDPSEYGSPLQPMLPIAPEGTEPKGFQWWWGQNLNFVPRPDAEYSAADLKLLATYPLARICIENAKDQICKAAWQIRLKPEEGETKKQLAQRSKGDETLQKLNELFEYPDSENNWSDWVRPLIDDMLVIDAASILMRKTFRGDIAELRVLRGESITRLIDKNGWTPQAPDPAYQQNWWGLPLVNLTTDQLVYKPRNIVPRNTVSSQLYGMSPTEQLADEIKIGMKRLEFWLAYYTEGSIPGLVHIVPKGTSPEKISEAMLWMNSELAGNLAARQQWRMIPGFNEPGKADQIIETKKELLTDPFDELHIRKICFGFGTSPQRLMRMMGTRNAEAQQEAAKEEGIMPWLDWLKGVIDHIIQRKMGLDDYEITFTPFHDPDPEKEATIAKNLVAGTIITPNEGRTRLGLDPWDPKQVKGDNEADMLGTVGASGFTPITGAGALSTPKPEPPKVPGGGPGGVNVSSSKQPGGSQSGAGAGKVNGVNGSLSKAHCRDHGEYDEDCIACAENEIRRLQAKVAPTSAVAPRRTVRAYTRGGGATGFAAGLASATLELPPEPTFAKRSHSHLIGRQIRAGKLYPSSIDAMNRLHRVLAPLFAKMEKKVLERVKSYAKLPDKVGKVKLKKAEGDFNLEELIRLILADLQIDWNSLPMDMQDDLREAVTRGVSEGLLQVEVDDSDVIQQVNTIARDWAEQRAAELVGMRRLDNGTLVENPDAKWVISDTTRDDIRTIMTDVFSEESPTMESLAQRIQQAGTFSDARAMMIAKTETISAEVNGNLLAWINSGVVTKVDWLLSNDHDLDDECDEAAEGGPYDLDEVPDFPAHPNCECVLVVAGVEGEEGEEGAE